MLAASFLLKDKVIRPNQITINPNELIPNLNNLDVEVVKSAPFFWIKYFEYSCSEAMALEAQNR